MLARQVHEPCAGHVEVRPVQRESAEVGILGMVGGPANAAAP